MKRLNFKHGGRAWGYVMRERGAVVELYYERDGARVPYRIPMYVLEASSCPRYYVAEAWRLVRDEWREWVSGNGI